MKWPTLAGSTGGELLATLFIFPKSNCFTLVMVDVDFSLDGTPVYSHLAVILM